jgi:hypothetical protein
MTDQPERPSYMKYAFANAYNLSLLGGAAVASAATSDWAIALIAGGLEALWLFIGADTAPFRRWVDRQHRARLLEATRARRRQRILALPDQRDRERAIDLIAAWVDLAEAADRFEGYIRELDLNRLQREQQVQQKLAEQSGQDPESRGLAAKNADLLGKRLRTLQDMGTLVQRTRGQMGVIENTFRLLRDQIASLKVPQDIHGQIDEIVTNVDAVRSVLAEGDQNLREVAEAPATVAYDEPAHGPRTRVR